MIPYFSTQHRVNLLQQEIDAWIGTPYIGHAGLKRAGCDCIRFSHAVLESLGLLPEVKWPPYSLRPISDKPYWDLRRALESLPSISMVFSAKVQPPDEGQTSLSDLPPLMPGDILIFSSGRAFHHTGLVRDSVRFAHSLPEIGVLLSSIDDLALMSKLRAVYRVNSITGG